MTIEATLKPGEARCPGPGTQDLVRRSGQEPPFPLNVESYEFLGDEDIPFSRYTSPAFLRLENDRMWNRTWQWACREEHIPNVGDYITYEVGTYSFLVARTAPDRIQAFQNACMHRGTKLRPSGSQGSAPEWRCSYHGWTWTLDGSLKDVPCRWDFPHVTEDKFHLPEAKVGCWGGFVFINMDPSSPSLEEYLGVLPEHFRNWSFADRYVQIHIAKELPCNWKMAQEAFMEAYHVMETHPHLLPSAADVAGQYDVFGEHVTRFYIALGVPSPNLKQPVTEQEILDFMIMSDRSLVEDRLMIKPGETARDALASVARSQLEAAFGSDLSNFQDTEVIDSIHYHVFPNMVLSPGLTQPLVYRFRPIGMDPSRCLFEMLFMQPARKGQKLPEPAEPVYLGPDASYTSVPGVDHAFGFIYDQDTHNLRMQQEGALISLKPGQTLSNYQEIRIRKAHQVLDKYLGS